MWAAAYVAFVFDNAVAVQALAYGSSLVVVLVVALRRRSADHDHHRDPDRRVTQDVIVS